MQYENMQTIENRYRWRDKRSINTPTNNSTERDQREIIDVDQEKYRNRFRLRERE